MSKELKVMKAPNDSISLEHIPTWPLLGSTKIDGFRVLVKQGKLHTSSMKLYLSTTVNKQFEDLINISKDGWVIDCESYSDSVPFEELSGIMRADVNPKLCPKDMALNVFDILTLSQWNNGGEPVFSERVKVYTNLLKQKSPSNCNIVKQTLYKDAKEVQAAYDKLIDEGYEGMMLRDPDGRYKHGRCTLNECNIIKFKEWMTSDVCIVDFEQGTRMKADYANSDRGKDETGHSKRSRTKENYELIDAIGSIIVEDEKGVRSGVHFAKDYKGPEVTWANRKKFINKIVEVRSMAVGVKEGLRLGGITRFREDKDD